MKKLVIAALICAMALTAPALAGTCPEVTKLEPDVPVEADLDGDGAAETVVYSMVSDGTDNEPTVNVTVTNAAGESCIGASDVIWNEAVYVCDLDSDGKSELFITGDIMSDDYYTWCYRYDGKALNALEFADANRGENTDGYEKCGYGLIMAFDDKEMSLAGSQDVLGTRFAYRYFRFTGERFEFNDDGLWIFNVNQDDPEIWEDYSCLTVKSAIPCKFDDEAGEGKGELAVGEKLVLLASDKVSVVYFMTQSGRTGRISIAPNTEAGWGWLVNGVDENEVFEYLPYAD